MIPETQIAALLHVSTVVSVLSLAFLGLDRSHIDTPNYKEGPEKAKITAKRVLARLDFDRTKPVSMFGHRTFPIIMIFAIAVICLIATEPLRFSRPLSTAHACLRQPKIPLFVYLTKWNHINVVGWIALFANAVLFLGAASILWGNPWPATFMYGWFAKFLLFALCASLIWMVVTGAAMRHLNARRLEKICRGLGIWVNREITRRLKFEQEEAQKRFDETTEYLKRMRDILQKQIDETDRRLATLKPPHKSNDHLPPSTPHQKA